MIDTKWALDFAGKWIAAFNSHDLEIIFSLYDDDFTMTSPYIKELMGLESGVLTGKSSIKPYWERALAKNPPIKFELIDVFTGISSIAIYYKSLGRKVVCETLTFNKEGKIVAGNSMHGKPL